MKKIISVVLFLNGFIGISQNWTADFDLAKQKAVKENKNIVLVFSGSDWCAPCMKLENTVWESAEFKSESENNWVTYKADFPKKKANQLPLELAEKNKKLAEKYNKEGNFPLVVLLDKTGKIIAKTGFKNASAKDYIKMIHSFEK